MAKITSTFILFIGLLLPQVLFSQGFQLATAWHPLNYQVRDVYEIEKLGAKYIRYPIYRNFNEPLELYITNIKVISRILEKRNIKLIVTLHVPSVDGLYSTINYKQFKKDWKQIAYQLQGYKAIFNIINEPRHRIDGAPLYKAYNDISRIIKRYSPRRPLMFASYGVRSKELESFNPDKFRHSKKDFIEVHLYDFIDQFGYLNQKPNRSNFKNIVTRLKNFQDKYRLKLFVGEVAFPAKHPDCSWYMQNILSRLNRNKIPFTIHAYNESNYWKYKDDCLNTILQHF